MAVDAELRVALLTDAVCFFLAVGETKREGGKNRRERKEEKKKKGGGRKGGREKEQRAECET